MGCGMSTEDKEGKARNEEIENQLKRDHQKQRNEIKMLLLGIQASPHLHVPELTVHKGLENLESQPFLSK